VTPSYASGATRVVRQRSLEDLHAELLPDEEWVHHIGPFESLGQRFEIRTTDPALAEFVDSLYASVATLADGDATLYSVRSPTADRVGAVHRAEELIGTGWRHSVVLDDLIWAINRQVIEGALNRLVLHSAAAAMGDAAVVLPAPMESGKTTLVTALLDRGLSYLTDEAAAIDGELTVQGYAKPLSIDPGSWGVLAHHRPRPTQELEPYLEDQWQLAPQDITSVIGRGQLHLVVFPKYEPDAPARLQRLSAGQAFARLVPCAFSPQDTPLGSQHVKLLAAIASTVPSFRLTFSALEPACQQVIRALEATARPSVEVDPGPPGDDWNAGHPGAELPSDAS